MEQKINRLAPQPQKEGGLYFQVVSTLLLLSALISACGGKDNTSTGARLHGNDTGVTVNCGENTYTVNLGSEPADIEPSVTGGGLAAAIYVPIGASTDVNGYTFSASHDEANRENVVLAVGCN